MKAIALFTVLVAMCLMYEAQGDCVHNGKTLSVGTHAIDCAQYTCHEDGHMTGLTCPAWMCAEEIGYKELDLSKPYPECCAGPICKE